jgi:hypothetical protein
LRFFVHSAHHKINTYTCIYYVINSLLIRRFFYIVYDELFSFPWEFCNCALPFRKWKFALVSWEKQTFIFCSTQRHRFFSLKIYTSSPKTNNGTRQKRTPIADRVLRLPKIDNLYKQTRKSELNSIFFLSRLIWTAYLSIWFIFFIFI